MTQPATNAQVALQAAVAYYGVYTMAPTQDELERTALEYLRWLDANTSPPADQPGERG